MTRTINELFKFGRFIIIECRSNLLKLCIIVNYNKFTCHIALPFRDLEVIFLVFVIF